MSGTPGPARAARDCRKWAPCQWSSRPSLREEGITGVHTHVRQLRRYLAESGTARGDVDLITPFSWGRRLSGCRIRCAGSPPASGWPASPQASLWYRHWHEMFLRRALRRHLARGGRMCHLCPGAAGGPGGPAGTAADRTSEWPWPCNFRISQADEWADQGSRSSAMARVFRAIRTLERARSHPSGRRPRLCI